MGYAGAPLDTPLHPLGMGRRPDRRSTQSVAAVLSLLIHAVLLFEAARIVLRMRATPLPIAVTLLQAAPPPPPGPAAVAAASSPVATAPIVAPIPVAVEPQKKPVIQEKPVVEQPKRPVLKRKREEVPPKQPPKTAEPQPAPVVAAPAPQPAVAIGAAAQGGGGVTGGIAGGTSGGKIGGIVGGQGDVVLRADQVASAPVPIKKTMPEYPAAARREGVEGLVVIDAVISRDGTVERGSIHVIESQAMFDDAAVEAFRTWRFRPGRNSSGDTVRVRVNVPLRFRLR